jgi:hypothetical protein
MDVDNTQLFHAMMAISALSLAHRAGSHKAEALEHYQQVLPAMRDFVRSEEDSNSDGALFTHYLLLLYDVSCIAHMQKFYILDTHEHVLLDLFNPLGSWRF